MYSAALTQRSIGTAAGERRFAYAERRKSAPDDVRTQRIHGDRTGERGDCGGTQLVWASLRWTRQSSYENPGRTVQITACGVQLHGQRVGRDVVLSPWSGGGCPAVPGLGASVAGPGGAFRQGLAPRPRGSGSALPAEPAAVQQERDAGDAPLRRQVHLPQAACFAARCSGSSHLAARSDTYPPAPRWPAQWRDGTVPWHLRSAPQALGGANRPLPPVRPRIPLHRQAIRLPEHACGSPCVSLPEGHEISRNQPPVRGCSRSSPDGLSAEPVRDGHR